MTTTEETATAEQAAADQAPAEMPVRPAAALAVRGADPSRALMAKIQYAKALADSGLLPAMYRRNPANVLYAVEYGDMLGIPAMAAINGVHVIEGKPSASAGLISALVRRAGHKIRVKGNSKTATCQIVRSDDPDYTYEVTWTLNRNADDNPNAEEAGLLGKQTWRNYPASMLKSRAITQCARDACEEALYGLHYTPEELGAEVDEEGIVLGEIVPDGISRETVQAENPDGDPWSVRTSEGATWLAEATERAAGFADLDAGRELWKETAARLRDGSIVKADADHLASLLKARNEELVAADAEILEGTVVADGLDPDDPWAMKIADIATVDEAADVLAELARTAGLDSGYHGQIMAAIDAKAASLAEAAA